MFKNLIPVKKIVVNKFQLSFAYWITHTICGGNSSLFQEERQEAEAYLMGGKEPTTLMMDPNVLLDSLPNSLLLGGQTKVPLKVTSLNFDNLCAAQTSTTYTTIVANAGGLRGLNGFFSHANQVSGNSGYNNSNNNTGQKQLGEQFVDGNKQMAPLLQRKGNQGENKVLLVPIQNFLKNISPAKDGIMHTTMCELPCPKKSSLCLSWAFWVEKNELVPHKANMCMKIDLFFTLSCCFALLSAGAVVSRGFSRVQHALYVEFITQSL